jgi:uncharacterized Zn finger protein (UPF0148 family)
LAMEELKSCLFCGKYIDKTYLYCPYCGYEFGRREDNVDFSDESAGEIISEFLPLEGVRVEAEERQSPEPPPVEEKKEGVMEYLARLQDMERLLAEMERELDVILSSAPQKEHARFTGKGQVTSSSKGP